MKVTWKRCSLCEALQISAAQIRHMESRRECKDEDDPPRLRGETKLQCGKLQCGLVHLAAGESAAKTPPRSRRSQMRLLM